MFFGPKATTKILLEDKFQRHADGADSSPAVIDISLERGSNRPIGDCLKSPSSSYIHKPDVSSAAEVQQCSGDCHPIYCN